MTSAFTLYRLPHAQTCIRVEGETVELYSCPMLNGAEGFVIAPFEVRADQPIVVIKPRSITEFTPKPTQEPTPSPSQREGSLDTYTGNIPSQGSHGNETYTGNIPSQSNQSPLPLGGAGGGFENRLPGNEYAIDFANFHAQLKQGNFRKIVLARCADEPARGHSATPEALFMRACELYPRLFIALVYTPQTGLWLTATPEILLEGEGNHWRTIALAGTMKLEGDALNGEGETATWNTKNIEEQRIVATYIAECLEQFTADFREEGPRTVRAANLVHLRSDFTFTMPTDQHIGDLLQALHPTPAVCGLPKREAFKFIVGNEHTPRRYYSGFMGPLNLSADMPQGSVAEPPAPHSTHLYVSLRCMSIDASGYHLYAGGGLLRDSILEQEWMETEAKLETMRRLLIEE